MFISAPRVVVCGSFHKGTEELKQLIAEFETCGCQILSPRSLRFEDTAEPFVKTGAEEAFDAHDIERFHLQAIDLCDLVWVHNPGGYIGVSGSFELGYAIAKRKPAYTKRAFTDNVMNGFITQANSVFEAVHSLKRKLLT